MPFDPIAWILGYTAKLGADSLLSKLKQPRDAADWRSTVVQWVQQDAKGTLQPEVLLQVPLVNATDPKCFIRQDESLDDSRLTQHFLTRWRMLRDSTTLDNLTPFFHLDEAEAASLLQRLSTRLVELDKKSNGGIVSALREVADDNNSAQRLLKQFVDFSDFAADKRLLYTGIALECRAPLGALYESVQALRAQIVGTLLPEVRSIPYHQNAVIIAKSLAASCVSFMRTCEEVDREYSCGLSTNGPRIEDLQKTAVEDVQAGLLAFRTSFCGTLLSALSELNADVPVAVAAGLVASNWPLSTSKFPCDHLTIDGVTWRTDGLYIMSDNQTHEPYVRIGRLANDAVVHDIYLPEGSEIIQRAPSEARQGLYGRFFSIAPGRDWHFAGALIRAGVQHQF